MYKEFYKLKRDPFRLTPDPAFVCMTPQHREAFSGLVYSVCTRPGLTVLVGEAGTGKTTLLYTLLGLLEKRRFVTAMCTNPTLTREEFYDLLLVKLGVECSSSLKSRQLEALQETLIRNRSEGRPSALIVDEAQRLSPELLEEIRLLLNLETPREKLLEIIVAGQPELAETLRRPELRQLKQRVSCYCKLNPLSLEELREYLEHRLAQAGLPQQRLFAGDTIRVIYEYTEGIPRLVNTLCDTALQSGFALRSASISALIIQEAADDLDLRPANPPAHLPSNGHQPAVAPVAAGPAPSPPYSHAPAVHKGSNGNGKVVSGVKTPPESYSTRQKTLSFLAGIMERWS